MKKTGVLKSAMKKTPKYNADVEMDFKNPVSYNKSNTNRKHNQKVKESDNSIGLSSDSINGHYSSVYTNLNAKRMEMGGNFDSTTPSLQKSNKVLPGSSGKKSKRLKSQYKINGQNSIIKGFDVGKMSMRRDILTPKKMNKTSKANHFRSNFNDSYETRSFADSDTQSHKTMQARRKRMSKSTVHSKQQKQGFEVKNKSKMFKEGYNIHTEFPSLNERKQKTPGLDKRTRKKGNRSNRRTQRALDHHYIDEANLQNNRKRNPSQNYEVKTEGYLPAIESLEGKSEYDGYQIDDGLSYTKGGKSVKSYRPHPLKDPSFGKNLKFSSVRISNMSKFKTLYLVNLREKMEECQKPAVPQERFVKIMDTNREISIPKLEQEEVEEEEEKDINIYSDSDQFEEEKVEIISSRATTPENIMIKRLRTKVAKGLHMQGKISMMPGAKPTSSMVKRKFEQSKDFKIALEMMSDLHTVDQFRNIQKSEFLTRNPFEDIDIMTWDIESYQTEEERKKMVEEIHTKHQKAYIKQCKKLNALPLPLLKKIKYDKFVLKNYQLNPAVTKAFGMSMHYLKDTLNGVILSNNNMKDSEIVLILEGMKYNPINSLIIENNKIGPLSLKSLCKIVWYDDGKWYASIAPKSKESLNRITRLELMKCDISQSLMTDFIEVLSKKNRRIEILKLSSFNFNKPMTANLGDYILENYWLKKLNLSWSEMMSDDMLFFMEKIKEIKHLQGLDISKIPIEGLNRIKVVEEIKEFIINNTSLTHLNMSCWNLLPDQLVILAEGIKKSKSLLSVHLSGNNLNEEGKNLLKDFLCRKKKKRDMFFAVNEDNEPDSPRTVVSMVSNRYDRKRLQNMKYDLYKQNQQKKLGLVLDNRGNFETVDDRIVVYRHLGHFEIKDGYTWKIHTSCWICDQWKYTCVITNPATIEGTFKDSSQINSKYYHQKIMDSNTERDFKKIEGSPNLKIAGTFSNWKCKEMMKIDKFYDCLIRNKLPKKRIYIEEKEDLISRISRILNIEIYTKFRNTKWFASQKRETAIERLVVKTAYKREGKTRGNKLNLLAMETPVPSYAFKDVHPVSRLQKKLMEGIKKTSHFNWFFAKEHGKFALFRSFKYGAIFSTEIEKKLELDNAHFMVSMKELGEDHKELKESTNENEDLSDYYVFATFMPPGDSKVIVSSEDIHDETSYYWCESIVPIRTEEILLHQKRTKKKFEVRQFEKHKSVFRDWHEDTNETLKSTFQIDISKTRLRKYTVRPRVYEEVCDILLVNYQRLKEIFNHCIGISSYPHMSWLEFTKLCTHWKLPDRNNWLMSTIDTCFIAANFDENTESNSPRKRFLCRHEFLEVLVRIADEKYRKSGIWKTLPTALGHLLNHNLFKHSNFIQNAQKFRDENLWTIRIDDLMFANMANIRNIYNMILIKPNIVCTLERVEEFWKQLDLSISTKMVKLAFSLCKMTISDDIVDREKYLCISFVEFLEFISRLAQLLFKKNKSMPLFDKIFYILQKMFRLIPAEAIKPETEYFLESESDDEEY